jgi:hypothetical protein
MRHLCTRRVAARLCLALLSSGSWPLPARGDGGTLREWKRLEGYDIAVFTDPTPVVTGSVDVSVLLLDPATGEPISDADITVEIALSDRPGAALRRAVTSEAATNKLLRAALFELPLPGRCGVLVTVEGPRGHAQVQFDLDVARSSTPSPGLWPWILWPFPVIAIYATHRRLVRSKDRSRTRVRRPASGDDTESASSGCDDTSQ